MAVVHVVFVGSDAEKVMESIKASGYPIHKAYLVYYADVKSVAEKLKEILKVLIDVEMVEVNQYEVFESMLKVLEAIRDDLKAGNEVYINITEAPKTLTIAAYIAAQVSGSKIYTAMPKYEEGKEVGIERVIEIPVPPMKKVSEDKLEILKVIEANGGEVESINKLIELLEGRTTDHKKYMAQRARMSYHLRGLEEDGLVETKRVGKNVKISLTVLGKAVNLVN
ncbi:conserved hypothetical protein [Ferroglobus placidus DSM 10642]|uniref:Uncharacterized protein n=1 Tax=Ferroglobus placidus (strain DSM 10642 / AEDII12DO) TaxID=589924 RepID=D3RYV3_FERPA|nr:DUF6293 family protein [Ferroglobus placidus]ADC65666.1 conserved hypothetical protein [Ferroglobus placidus DSM 10642]